eukprot:321615-Prymnesium_polylepis.1
MTTCCGMSPRLLDMSCWRAVTNVSFAAVMAYGNLTRTRTEPSASGVGGGGGAWRWGGWRRRRRHEATTCSAVDANGSKITERVETAEGVEAVLASPSLAGEPDSVQKAAGNLFIARPWQR